jgi:hypothetical protein
MRICGKKQTNQQPIITQIKSRKWGWIGHTLRKPMGAIEKDALDWNPQGVRRRHGRERSRRKLLEKERHGRKSRRCQHTGPNG